MGLVLVFLTLSIGPSLNTITGLIITVAGIVNLTSPALTYDENKIELKNGFGMTTKTYVFGVDEIATTSGKIYVNGKKFKVARSLAASREYDELVAFIIKRDGGKVSKMKKSEALDEPLQDDTMEIF